MLVRLNNGFWLRNRLHSFAFLAGLLVGLRKKNFRTCNKPQRSFPPAISDTAALVERVKQLQEELAAFVNEQTNRTLFVLTLTMVTVLALPINLVAGLFGMNVGGIPLESTPHTVSFGSRAPCWS